MGNNLVDPNVLQLMHSFKPFLSSNGQVITDSMLNIVHLISSDHAQNTIQSMGKMITGQENAKMVTVRTGAGNVTFSLQIAFSLFLILILLILSVLSFNFDIFGMNPLDPTDIAVNEVDVNDEEQYNQYHRA